MNPKGNPLMATKKPSKPRPGKVGTLQAEVEKPIALTLKLDSATFVRLSTFRAKKRRTAQDILTEALTAYLEHWGA